MKKFYAITHYPQKLPNFYAVSGNLISSTVPVHVCDDSNGCFPCEGGDEKLKLTGVPGWNYVMCEQIGDSLKIMTAADDLSSDEAKLGVCEVEILSQPGQFIRFSDFHKDLLNTV